MAETAPAAPDDAAPIAPLPAQRPLPAAPGYVKSAFRGVDLSLNEMRWSRRTLFAGLLGGAPVVFALLVRGLVFVGAPIVEQNVVRNGSRSTILVPGPVVFGYVMW